MEKPEKDWPEKINNNNNKLVVLKEPTGRDIGLRYKLGKELWRAESGIIYDCTDRETGELLSCKSISKEYKLRTAIAIEDLRREVEIMRHLPNHPNIVSLKDTYEDDDDVHLVTEELCIGRNLLNLIVGRGYYSERSAASIVKSIVEVVQPPPDSSCEIQPWSSLLMIILISENGMSVGAPAGTQLPVLSLERMRNVVVLGRLDQKPRIHGEEQRRERTTPQDGHLASVKEEDTAADNTLVPVVPIHGPIHEPYVPEDPLVVPQLPPEKGRG
ncbi:hypothetical protein TSUD_24120 [Trifolium subterraneum]|uniref:Protein kinase domain-containing protein n=1 Tax=Trifolium subterraneum TaxID=3900 RepID=A0A2Z6NNQ2_TRISU|nr:hypothetical protein TSUD_24120 [Trifolium subterraneum]